MKPPVAPGARAVLGHVRPLLKDLPGLLASCAGAGPVQRLRLGPRDLYLLTEPEPVRQALALEGDALCRVYEDGPGRLFGEALLGTAGPAHRARRRMLQPAFRHELMACHADVIGPVAARLAANWSPGRPVDMVHESVACAAEAMWCVLTGVRPARMPVSDPARRILDVDRGAAEETGLFSRAPAPVRRRHRCAAALLRRMLVHAIDTLPPPGGAPAGLLGVLAQVRDRTTRERLSRRQVLDQALEMLVAGAVATGMILAWACHELGRHPYVEHRLQEETDEVLGGRPARHEDLARLPYAGRVVTEVLRLAAPPLVGRRALRELDLAGYRVPQGADVAFCPHALHRHPDLYPDPLRFDPDRWLPGRARTLPRGAFLPFGAGDHQCIGSSLGTAHATLALCTIAGAWRLRPVPEHRIRCVRSNVLRPDALPMTAEPRGPVGRLGAFGNVSPGGCSE
ncbi:cytochrome P450 [Streptoverticillium reticulum]|uniref:cytochrome P450 n=1 Tax=Streptomyces TaxID=1883 RepID=UPI003699F7C4